MPISRDSKLYYERMKACRPKLFDQRIIDYSTTVATTTEGKAMVIKDVKGMDFIGRSFMSSMNVVVTLHPY